MDGDEQVRPVLLGEGHPLLQENLPIPLASEQDTVIPGRSKFVTQAPGDIQGLMEPGRATLSIGVMDAITRQASYAQTTVVIGP